MTTFEEQLDELLSMAADAGRLSAEQATLEKERDFALNRVRAGRYARDAKAQYTRAERRLSSARQRFLTRHAGKL